MGLDMYMYKERFLSQYTKDPVEQKLRTEYNNAVKKLFGVDYEQDTVRLNVMYWRKANAIHKWFVDNCADGVDDCEEVFVPNEKLEQLLEVCKAALKVYDENKTAGEGGEFCHAPEKLAQILPTQSGFFFGPTEYGKYYRQNLEETIKFLEAEIKRPDFKGWYYSYRASW